MLSGTKDLSLALSFDIFQEMKACFYDVKDWYKEEPKVNSSFIDFIGGEDNFLKKIQEISKKYLLI